MAEDTGHVRSGTDRRSGGEVTCGYHGDIVNTNTDMKLMNTELKTKMNGIIKLLVLSVVILGGIFTSQIMTATSFGSINTTLLNQQQDIDALKSLTRDHASIVKAVSILEGAVKELNERYPVYFKK
jgi:capsular polysaccharide biosynthesis protein